MRGRLGVFTFLLLSLGWPPLALGVRGEPAAPALSSAYAPIHPPREPEEGPPEVDAEELEAREKRRQRRIDRVLRRARRFLGKRSIYIDGRRFRWDCVGILRAAFFREFDTVIYRGAPKTGSGVLRMWYFAKQRGGIHFRRIPERGDLIFFHQSYDANGNRKADDSFTHVAIVERVDKWGTITYIDRAVSGIARRRMNLYYPNLMRHPVTGKVINSHVRPRRRWDEKGAKHLAGQLFAGFATLIK